MADFAGDYGKSSKRPCQSIGISWLPIKGPGFRLLKCSHEIVQEGTISIVFEAYREGSP